MPLGNQLTARHIDSVLPKMTKKFPLTPLEDSGFPSPRYLERGFGVLLQELGEAVNRALACELDDVIPVGGDEEDGGEALDLRGTRARTKKNLAYCKSIS